jgi:hypothetical protein
MTFLTSRWIQRGTSFCKLSSIKLVSSSPSERMGWNHRFKRYCFCLPLAFLSLELLLTAIVSQMYFQHCAPPRLPLSRDSNIRAHARREIEVAFEKWHSRAQTWERWNESHQLSLLLKVIY